MTAAADASTHWKDIVYLLKGTRKNGILISDLLCDIIQISDLPDIFHHICCTNHDYITSKEWKVRKNSSYLIQKLIIRHIQYFKTYLLKCCSSDGIILTIQDINISSILSQNYEPLLAGPKSSYLDHYDITVNMYKKSWLKRQRKELIKRLGLSNSSLVDALKNDSTFELIGRSDVLIPVTKSMDEDADEGECDVNDNNYIDIDSTSENWFIRIIRLLTVGLLDECWEARHGYCMCLSNIVLSLSSHSSSSIDLNAAQVELPIFLFEDILSSGVCVLLLDRFLDFKVNDCDSMLSPVKEMIGQLILISLNSINDPVYYRQIYNILLEMSTFSLDWNIRYSGIIALKYFVTAITSGKYEKSNSLSELYAVIVTTLTMVSVEDQHIVIQVEAVRILECISLSMSNASTKRIEALNNGRIDDEMAVLDNLKTEISLLSEISNCVYKITLRFKEEHSDKLPLWESGYNVLVESSNFILKIAIYTINAIANSIIEIPCGTMVTFLNIGLTVLKSQNEIICKILSSDKNNVRFDVHNLHVFVCLLYNFYDVCITSRGMKESSQFEYLDGVKKALIQYLLNIVCCLSIYEQPFNVNGTNSDNVDETLKYSSMVHADEVSETDFSSSVNRFMKRLVMFNDESCTLSKTGQFIVKLYILLSDRAGSDDASLNAVKSLINLSVSSVFYSEVKHLSAIDCSEVERDIQLVQSTISHLKITKKFTVLGKLFSGCFITGMYEYLHVQTDATNDIVFSNRLVTMCNSIVSSTHLYLSEKLEYFNRPIPTLSKKRMPKITILGLSTVNKDNSSENRDITETSLTAGIVTRSLAMKATEIDRSVLTQFKSILLITCQLFSFIDKDAFKDNLLMNNLNNICLLINKLVSFKKLTKSDIYELIVVSSFIQLTKNIINEDDSVDIFDKMIKNNSDCLSKIYEHALFLNDKTDNDDIITYIATISHRFISTTNANNFEVKCRTMLNIRFVE